MNVEHILGISEILARLPDSRLTGRYALRAPDTSDLPRIADGVIHLSQRFLVYLWYAAAFYSMLYEASIQAYKTEAQGKELKLLDVEPRLDIALTAMATKRKAILDPLSDQEFDLGLSDLEVARIDSLYQRAAGWTIYHETGHAELPATGNEQEEEYAADEFATACTMDWAEEDDKGFTQACGISAALLALCSIKYVEDQDYSETSHPHAYKRLLAALDQIGLGQDSHALYFVSLVLRADLQLLGLDWTDEEPAASFRELLEFHISKLESKIDEAS